MLNNLSLRNPWQYTRALNSVQCPLPIVTFQEWRSLIGCVILWAYVDYVIVPLIMRCLIVGVKHPKTVVPSAPTGLKYLLTFLWPRPRRMCPNIPIQRSWNSFWAPGILANWFGFVVDNCEVRDCFDKALRSWWNVMNSSFIDSRICSIGCT